MLIGGTVSPLIVDELRLRRTGNGDVREQKEGAIFLGMVYDQYPHFVRHFSDVQLESAKPNLDKANFQVWVNSSIEY
jgi:hypothetical protein